MGKFVIKIGNKGQFYFSLKTDNGQKILSSEGYNSKSACTNGIDSVKNNAKDENKYERKESSNGKYYFNLIASNGHIIGTSELYDTTTGRDAGIESVKSNAPGAGVEEE
jgi:uncharacterized protein YegP (UPF0339 family)